MKSTLTLLAGLLITVCAAMAQPAGPGGDGQQSLARSPEILADGTVVLRLAAPNAASVKAVNTSGGFQDWPQGNNLGMTKDEQGVWSVTIGPLKSEYYNYVFEVDGVRALDPRNVFITRDGARYANALRLPGDGSANYDVTSVPHGTLSVVWYPSRSLKLTRRMYVYTSPGYEGGTMRYPVLYLLHGGGGDEDAWTNLGRASEILDNLIAKGKAQPMIVVMTNGNANQQASQDFVASAPAAAAPRSGGEATGPASAITSIILKFPQSLVQDVLPFVDRMYRTKTDRESRAIAGLSMGGAQTLYAAFNNLDKFAWVASFSGGFPLLPGIAVPIPAPANAARLRGPDITRSIDPDKFAALLPQLNPDANGSLRLFYLSIGVEDGLITTHGVVKDVLKSHGVKATLWEAPGYGHEWSFWRLSLADLASRLFQPESR